ncbi:unnamed protein product [Brachionus calyciflorus]|uniref:NR LBD domain-containing protein n=1 Tax=Brachionus calyciflorus TaxID=104777 RepID=A0A814BII2_9BILA|nr:unnamed protein product [Brachionus calyciflorus]
MDPTIVLKYVREQRRQINDSFNTQQKLSPNSTGSSISPNSPSPNQIFQPPQTAQMIRGRYPNPYPIDPNSYPQKIDMYMMNRINNQKNNNYYHQSVTEPINRSSSVKSDSGIGSNSPSSDNSDYNSNYIMNQQKNYKIQQQLQQQQQQSQHPPQHPSPQSQHQFQMVKKHKNTYDETNIYPSNFNKIPLHNSYYANHQQICDKECCAHLKQQINVQKPVVPKHTVPSGYCDCKECNEMLKKSATYQPMHPPAPPMHQIPQALPPGYCDCSACNLALANAKNSNSILAHKPVMHNPMPPIPTNRFVISQNSSFSPITSTRYPSPIVKKDNYNRYLESHGKCSCPECLKALKSSPGEMISPKVYSPKSIVTPPQSLQQHQQQQQQSLIKIAKPNQQINNLSNINNNNNNSNKIPHHIGLTLPIVLGSEAACYDHIQNITKQRNFFYNESLAKRKLEEDQTSHQQVYYKKNRVLVNQEKSSPIIKNNSDSGVILLNNDTELGEIVQKSTDSEPSVIISKKMMPIITKRTTDWLEKSVEFTFNLSAKTGISLDKLYKILCNSWSKILLVYMIEYNLEFYVTPDYSSETSESVNLPKEKEASQLMEVISKGFQELSLETNEYDLLREIVMFSENSEFSENYVEANTKLQNILCQTESRYENLISFLPSIQNVKKNLIENLFYRNSQVEDILSKKMNDLVSKRETKQNDEQQSSNLDQEPGELIQK